MERGPGDGSRASRAKGAASSRVPPEMLAEGRLSVWGTNQSGEDGRGGGGGGRRGRGRGRGPAPFGPSWRESMLFPKTY